MKLILNGGGEGLLVEAARKEFNNSIDSTKKILYIPLAWTKDETYESCLVYMKEELSDVNCTGIEMIKDAKEILTKDLTAYAGIYIGGGNTYKLLYELKESKAFEKVKDYLLNQNGIVYGGSAGAIIFGKDLDSCNLDDENVVNLIDNKGFNMLNGHSLLCHYTNRSEEETEQSKEYLLELSKIKPIYAIPEEDTIIVEDGNIRFIGEKTYYEFINGEMYEKGSDKIWRI